MLGCIQPMSSPMMNRMLGFASSLISATRRLSARPSGVLLLAMGWFWPAPSVSRREAWMPRSTSADLTALAL